MQHIILGLLFFAIIAYEGFKQLATGKYSGKQDHYQKYTVESVALSARLSGIFAILCGVTFLFFRLSDGGIIPVKPSYIFLIGSGVCIACYLVFYFAIPRKRGADYLAPVGSEREEIFIDED